MPLQNLGMTDWKGSKNNNLLELNGMTTQVYLDEGAPDSERFKIVTGSNGAGGIAVSADGIRWGEVKDLQTETHARWDTPKNLVWDPARRQWIIYVRSTPTIQEAEAGSLRVQSYVHSLTEDFMGNWSVATPTGLNSSAHYQPDGLVVFPYEGIYIGIGNVSRPLSGHRLFCVLITRAGSGLQPEPGGRAGRPRRPGEHGAGLERERPPLDLDQPSGGPILIIK